MVWKGLKYDLKCSSVNQKYNVYILKSKVVLVMLLPSGGGRFLAAVLVLQAENRYNAFLLALNIKQLQLPFMLPLLKIIS